MDIYYNYAYLEPRKPGKFAYKNICFLYEPIYIGKGKNNRKYDHLIYFNNNKYHKLNKILLNKLNKIYLNKIEPIICDFYYTLNEKLAYDNEKLLINEIGTIDGETILRGPLCNFCLDNRPPNFKGKTYYEIYGENAEYQLKKRKEKQISVGGYFKNKTHTKETKNKISLKTTGINNPRYKCIVKQETKNKISIANKGKKSKLAKTYIIHNSNVFYKVIGNDLKIFCEQYNISLATLQKYLNTNNTCKYGKTKNWYMFHINLFNIQETEIISYTTGAFKQDIDEQNFDDIDF
jgi:hypothetical protein